MFIPSERKKRLNLDIIGQLEDELEVDKLNYETWQKLIQQVLAKDKEEQVRAVMGKYLSIFKFDGDQWCNYINYEMSRGEFKNVQKLFTMCLANTTSVPLFRLYVSYVRRVNDVITGGDKARSTVVQAFEFAIKRVGLDISSSDLWEDYLDFLKSWTPGQTWEQQQKVDSIRKVYKKLLQTPTEKLEKIWSVYTNWENDLNPATAKKFIGEKSAEYMLARSWYTEWTNITQRKLRRDTIIPFKTFDENKDHRNLIRSQLNLWYAWIELEKKNKLEIRDETVVQQRIEFVYRKALTTIPFAPELWFYFNKFWLSSNEEANLNKCIELLNEGLVLNPRSCILTFQLSELYEKEISPEKSKETFQNAINTFLADLDVVNKSINDLISNAEVESANNNNDENMDIDSDDEQETHQELTQGAKVLQLSESDVEKLSKLEKIQSELNKVITLIYTKFMISTKRSGGIKEARSVFKNARQSFKAIGHDFYVQNALIEYYSDKRDTANRVFQLGMKSFNKNGEFLLKYLDYMIMINDIENMRVLFEQGLTTLLREITTETEGVEETPTTPLQKYLQSKKDKDILEKKEYIREMFKRFSKFETKFGDLNAVKSLESRYEQYFPDDDQLDLFSDRYTEPGTIDAIKLFDMGYSEDELPKQTSFNFNRTAHVEKSISDTCNEVENYDLKINETTAQQPLDDPNQQFVGSTTYNLLRALPSSSYFGGSKDHVFDSKKIVELLLNMPKVPGLDI